VKRGSVEDFAYCPRQTSDYVDGATGASLGGSRQEILPFGGGEILILRDADRWPSEIETTEIADTCSFGFHLGRGGDLRFDKAPPLEIVEGDCLRSFVPRGMSSRFTPPPGGYGILLALFSPEAAKAFCESRGFPPESFDAPADLGDVHIQKPRPMSVWGRSILQTLCASPFTGSARRLHLESGVLALMAEQLNNPDPDVSMIAAIDRRRLDIAREMLEAEFEAPPSIEAIARASGLNDFRLKRDFKRLFGMSPHAYARDLRLNAAAVALCEGESVKGVARRAGYACSSRFSQAFRRRFGMPPSAWR
jgi:AraC-like DNA-binding protein